MRRSLLDTALFAPDFPRSHDMARNVDLMRRAIGERRLLEFGYTRADGAQTRRSARPLGLYFWGNKWTLAAWCELRSDYRNFRPDRMQAVRVLESTFDPDDGINLADFLARMEAQDEERPTE